MKLVMKRRLSTFIEEEVIRQAKRLAVKEGRSLSDVIHDTLVSYLNDKVTNTRSREKAYELFSRQPMRLSKKQFKEIMGNEAWDR